MSEKKSGFVFLHKQPGITSFKTLECLKDRKNKYKVGHTGTLDKFAEGLLVAVIGKMTKFSSYITDLHKEYISEIRLGIETDTLDPEGKVIATSGYKPSQHEVTRALEKHTGRIEQIPPVYSAVHSGGRRAYQLARSGAIPELKMRKVHIHEIELLAYDYPLLQLRTVCSKGTYIRSLARDIAYSCGAVAYVHSLIRTKIGPFRLDEAVPPQDASPEKHLQPPKKVLERLDFIHLAHVKNGYVKKLQEGQKISPTFFQSGSWKSGLHAVFDSDDRFVALIEGDEKGFSYKITGKNL